MTILSRTAIVEICKDLELFGLFGIAKEIKEHDTAQREAQAQLAEAVGLLRKLKEDQFFEDYSEVDAFLSHHAQAEQAGEGGEIN